MPAVCLAAPDAAAAAASVARMQLAAAWPFAAHKLAAKKKTRKHFSSVDKTHDIAVCTS